MAKPPREGSPSTGGEIPSRYPEIPPPQVQPSGDYSYTLEVVMAMQGTLGKLTEAVESLKIKTESHSSKLEAIGKDVHAAKVVVGVVGALIVAAGAAIGFTIKEVLEYLAKTPH